MFKSGLEEKVSDLLCELGVDYDYESVSFAYTIQHLYTPDFILPNGVVLETKGDWRPEARRKVRQVIEENPDIIDSVSHQSDSQIETISEGEEEGEES